MQKWQVILTTDRSNGRVWEFRRCLPEYDTAAKELQNMFLGPLHLVAHVFPKNGSKYNYVTSGANECTPEYGEYLMTSVVSCIVRKRLKSLMLLRLVLPDDIIRLFLDLRIYLNKKLLMPIADRSS